MSILSWLFGAPGWLLAGGLILVAVFGLVPSISKWLWVACIVAVGAQGLLGLQQLVAGLARMAGLQGGLAVASRAPRAHGDDAGHPQPFANARHQAEHRHQDQAAG